MSGSAEPPIEGRQLRYYARIYDDLHQGETYTAEAFVLWLIKEVGLESTRKRAYHIPAGKPGKLKATAAA